MEIVAPEDIAKLTQMIERLIAAMGLAATVQPEQTITKGLVFNIALAQDSYMLIGHRGAHLHSLEILSQAMAVRVLPGKYVRFSLDVDDYRRKREWYIKETVRGAVEQLKRTGQPVSLLPMPNYERKLVHSLVSELYPEVQSASSGFDSRRRVIIRMKN
jgi:spoIIIJ-associated protein